MRLDDRFINSLPFGSSSASTDARLPGCLGINLFQGIGCPFSDGFFLVLEPFQKGGNGGSSIGADLGQGPERKPARLFVSDPDSSHKHRDRWVFLLGKLPM